MSARSHIVLRLAAIAWIAAVAWMPIGSGWSRNAGAAATSPGDGEKAAKAEPASATLAHAGVRSVPPHGAPIARK
jgi:hypothetical protein